MNEKLVLNRLPEQSIETKGNLSLEDGNVFKTLELAWLGNKNKVSCIPIGTYDWIKCAPTKKIPYEHIAILNVPGRLGIRIHAANFAAGQMVQLLGCIAVGETYADLNGDKIDDITASKKTLEKLMGLLPNKGTITIK